MNRTKRKAPASCKKLTNKEGFRNLRDSQKIQSYLWSYDGLFTGNDTTVSGCYCFLLNHLLSHFLVKICCFLLGQRKVSTCPSKYIRIPVIAIAAAAAGGSGLLYANSKHRDSGEISVFGRHSFWFGTLRNCWWHVCNFSDTRISLSFRAESLHESLLLPWRTPLDLTQHSWHFGL